MTINKYTKVLNNALNEFERREIGVEALKRAFEEYNFYDPDSPEFSDDDQREIAIVDFLIALIHLCEIDTKINLTPENLLRFARQNYMKGFIENDY